MPRVALTALVAAALALTVGCGKTYDKKMQAAIDTIKFQKELDDATIAAPTEGGFESIPVYLRPPKPLTPQSSFGLAEIPQGLFDLAASFKDTSPEAPINGATSLHVLARSRGEVKPAAKGENAPNRGEFEQDVMAIVGELPQLNGIDSKSSNGTSRGNAYKRVQYETGEGAGVTVYLFRRDDADVALILDAPRKLPAVVRGALDLTLGAVFVGDSARRAAKGQFPTGKVAD